MPYTPPSKSPALSASSSPDVSRQASVQSLPEPTRPSLPRSASYLIKHRRTPSAITGEDHGSTNQSFPLASSEELKAMIIKSVRQSPPPVTDGQSMPKGAVLSPPESSASSDEDDLPELRGRRIENLKELQEAISHLPQKREGSPDKANQPPVEAPEPIALPHVVDNVNEGMHHCFSASSLEDLARARRTSHKRSITMQDVPLMSQPAGVSLTNSEDEENAPRPSMVRKKSGELVRPALRPAFRRRPSSMPGTPTFSKAVHFDSHLEHVRHFLQVDRPLAVSAGSSPADNYDSDSEYPFGTDALPAPKMPSFEWEISMTKFPAVTPSRIAQPVRLERVWLSNDHKFMIGSVIVANLAFFKAVTCRFTVDYWKTTSEVSGEYAGEVTPRIAEHGHDRFNFSIKLSDLANLETKTLYFAIRYSVNGQELWDNNNGVNFQVDFCKKMLPQNGKRVIGAANRSVNGLPKSSRRSNLAAAPRPKSMPVGFDDFADNAKVNFEQSIHEMLGETGPIKLKSNRSSNNVARDNLSTRLAAPSGQAFANRYDFGASLSAAMQAAKDPLAKSESSQATLARKTLPLVTNMDSKPVSKEINHSTPTHKKSTAPNNSSPLSNTPVVGLPGATSIASSSYEEIVNKYCFFGSKQTSPLLQDGKVQGGKFDGTDDYLRSGGSVSSSAARIPNTHISKRCDRNVQQRQPSDPFSNPYFHPAARTDAVGASPAVSPLGTTILQPNHSSTSVLAQSSGHVATPAPMGSGLTSSTATSPYDFASYNQHDRFPFLDTDAHTATAIRGN